MLSQSSHLSVADQIDSKGTLTLKRLPQERFQVKSPPSNYLNKIKSFYQDQGGVSRRVSVNDHLLFIFNKSLIFYLNKKDVLILTSSATLAKEKDSGSHTGPERSGDIPSHQSHWVSINRMMMFKHSVFPVIAVNYQSVEEIMMTRISFGLLMYY